MIQSIREKIIQSIQKLQAKDVWADFDVPEVEVSYPPNEKMGDYTTNIALTLASKLKKNPMEIAQELAPYLENGDFEKVEAVSPGYINFFMSKSVFRDTLRDILAQGDDFGKGAQYAGEKIMVEYTDPNPFKVFHIGHLMTNIIGESLARLYEYNGAEVKRAVYQGDVGMHVAKSLWGVMRLKNTMPDVSATPEEYASFLGEAYVMGSNAYKDDDAAQQEIREINKKVYDRSDSQLNELYDIGRKKSLEYFEHIYKKLGTAFDYYFFESQTAPIGKALVLENIPKDVFKESEGAVIFSGEQYGLHTRVFLNKEQLPTYEAKDLGLSQLKYEKYPYDTSVIVTAHEQKAYFEVVLKALSLISPEIAQKTEHVDHGMLRLTSGKMSSRKGNVIAGDALLKDTIQAAMTKVQSEDIETKERQKIAESVGVGALKYSILKQSIGRDIVYDMEKSLALEGSSGPYLQYTFVRTQSVLRKAVEMGISPQVSEDTESTGTVEQLLIRFSEVILAACREKSPHVVCEYLFTLAQAYNGYYAKNKIINEENLEITQYRLALTQAVGQVMKNGLHTLGISVPKRM